MSDSNIYLGTIEKTGEKVLVWGGTYDMEDASMRWYEINENRDWSDDKFSHFRLLSTHQLRLALAKTATQLAQAPTNRLDDCECDMMSGKPPLRFLIKGKFVSRRKYYPNRLTHWGASND